MEKKRLNVIDYIFIVFVILLIIMVVFYIKDKKSQAGPNITGNKNISFTVEAENLLPSVAEAAKVDAPLVAMNRYQKGKIKDVEIYPDYRIVAVDGKIVKKDLINKCRLRVVIDAEVNQYGPYMEIGGQEVKVGVNYWIKTDNMHAYGMIIDVNEE